MRSLFVWEAGKRNLTIKFPHTHTHIQAQSYSSFPRETILMGAAFLRWLTPRWQAHYSRVSGDLGVKVISQLPPALCPTHLAAWATRTPRSIQITDSTGGSACSVPGNTFAEWLRDTWSPDRKLIFCPTTMLPVVIVPLKAPTPEMEFKLK